jgi:hypothetical protein
VRTINIPCGTEWADSASVRDAGTCTISALGFDSQIVAAALEVSMQDSGWNDVVRPEASFQGVVGAQDCPIPRSKAAPKLELPHAKTDPIRQGIRQR